MRDRLFYIKLGVVFFVIVSVLVYFYTVRLHAEIEKNTLLVIEETARHDRQSIQTCTSIFFGILQGVEERLWAANCDTIHALELRLNQEGATTQFNRIYLLAEDGTLYTDKFLVYPPGAPQVASLNFAGIFGNTEGESLVFRYDENVEAAGISRESLLYAKKLKDFIVGDVKMTTLVGLSDIKTLQQYFIIDSFINGGEAYGISSVIDPTGNYVVGGARNVYLNDDENFFTTLAMSSSATMTKRDIQNKMREYESFHFYMDTRAGEKLVYFVPFSDQSPHQPNWYFIMVVDNDYLEKHQAMFLIMSITLLALVVLVLFAMMVFGIMTRNRVAMAEQTVRVRGEFLSNMSHEIRTPLNGILGLNYLISKNIDNHEKLGQIKAWLSKSKILADYLLALLNDILDMSRLRAGHVDLASKKFSISKMMHDLTYMQNQIAESKGVYIVLHQKLTHPDVIGDEVHTKQIITNILSNAIKFTRKDGNITINVSQTLLDEDHVLTTYVIKDTGIGMPQDFLEKIFDPFEQEAAGKAATPLKGTGLGMPISKELATAMGGTIQVRSAIDVGSEFTVRLPALIARETAGEETSPEPSAPSTPLSRRVLLAEDAEFNAEFLMDVLKEHGFEVTLAVNGQEAVEKFEASAPDDFGIILMDMEMPVMDGCQAARKIRDLHRPDAKTVLIFACTANAFQGDKDRALGSGMNDFLTKPIDVDQFVAKLKEYFP